MFSLEKKGFPNGISDFKLLREEKYYYVDKTELIEELQREIGKTILFTRPRRFGKTLNMSMLQYFWDISNKEENRKLFQGLKIERSPYMEEQGKYPVIYITLKDMKYGTWKEILEEMRFLVSELFYSYQFLLKDLNEFDIPLFKNIIRKKANISELSNSLKLLSRILKNYYQKKVVILIDEYDTPIVSAYEHEYYEEAISFFRNFYSAALKDNSNLQLGVMTGILRVAKEGIFSGLNNLSVYSILDEKYSSYFGLTEKEVREALEYYELDYNIQEVKEWYDGYLFGNTEMYNPWSIISYMANKKIEAYWIGTSSNALILSLIHI